MDAVDSSAELSKWLSERRHILTTKFITTRLIVLESASINKATITLESSTHVGNITAWGGGTFEIIVLDLATKKEVLFRHQEFSIPEELRLLLDEYSELFSNLSH